MSRAHIRLLRTTLVLYAAVSSVVLAVGWDGYFGPPNFQVGDYASNTFQIAKAKGFGEILGNYSRWGFHHPGPAFFYVYAAGEWVFHDLLGLTRATGNAHLLTGALLQAAFFTLTLVVASGFIEERRRSFLAIAAVAGGTLFMRTGHLELSNWPPAVLALPFALLLVSAIAVAAGQVWRLPLLVLAGSFLVHGHVAQPMFVGTIAAAAYGRLYVVSGRPGLRAFIRRSAAAHALAALIAAPFVTTLTLDAVRGADSNLVRIATMKLADGWHSPKEAVFYIMGFADLAPRTILGTPPVNVRAVAMWAGLLLVPVLVRWRPPILRVWMAFVGLAFALVFVWAIVQAGDLYHFNAFFMFGLLFVVLLPVVMALSARLPVIPRWACALLFGVATWFAHERPLPGVLTPDPRGTQLEEAASRLTPSEPVLLRFKDATDWPLGAGFGLGLERHGGAFYVEPQWWVHFGREHVDPGTTTLRWTLGKPTGEPGEIVLCDGLAILPETVQ